MSLGTILLIAVAAAVVILMYRVGRGSREAAPAHGTAQDALPLGQDAGAPAGSVRDPEGQGQVDHQGHGDHGHESEGEGRERHGCC
jgi:hypothetical protein